MAPPPDFFVIGAPKCGTTSLYQILDDHPQIYVSPIKEPNYFSTDIDPGQFSPSYRHNTFLNTEKYFQQDPLPQCQITFVRKKDHYQQLYEAAQPNQITGECSTSYMYSKDAAQNIDEHNPEARIIAILRNPIERAWSHYRMALATGHTDLPFREALEKDRNQDQKDWGISELFIELGMYYEQLKRYFDRFPEQQRCILFFEELRESPNDLANRLYRFLGVKEHSLTQPPHPDRTLTPKWRGLNRLMTKSGGKKTLRRLLPAPVKRGLKRLFFNTGENNQLSARDREFLADLYRSDIEKTGELLDRDLVQRWLGG